MNIMEYLSEEDSSNVGVLERSYNDVREFHLTFKHPAPPIPTKISDERKKIRAEWMREEVQEFLDAKDLTEEVDAMVDLMYFALGTCVEMGIDPSIPFSLVQEANMAKIFPDGKPHWNEDNKVIKPEGWVAPDEKIRSYIEEVIKTHANQYTLFDE